MLDRIIELLKYLILAIVQGVGEILPISSSGHLVIVRNLLGIEGEGVSIELALHLASLVALFIYYRKTIFSLFKGCFRFIKWKDKNCARDFKFVRGMIISLIPVCIIGYFFDDYLDSFLKYPFLIGMFLIINGVNLYLIRNKICVKKIEELSLFSFFKIGVGQCFGLIPGISRSGSALSMCYRENMNKEDSGKFTFLMLFPLVLGSIILNIDDFSFSNNQYVLLSVSFIVTFMITLFSIKFLNKIIKNNKIHYFAYYCLIVGVIVMFIG